MNKDDKLIIDTLTENDKVVDSEELAEYIGAGGEEFVITLTHVTSNEWSADKTEEEVFEAYQSGKTLIVKMGLNDGSYVTFPLTQVEGSNEYEGIYILTFSKVILAIDGEFRAEIIMYVPKNLPYSKSGKWLYYNPLILEVYNTENNIILSENMGQSIHVTAYKTSGQNEDGTMTQKAITNLVNGEEVGSAELYPTILSNFQSMISEAITLASTDTGKAVTLNWAISSGTARTEAEALINEVYSSINPVILGMKVSTRSASGFCLAPFSSFNTICVASLEYDMDYPSMDVLHMLVTCIAGNVTNYTPS